jgi:hypothetical protein
MDERNPQGTTALEAVPETRRAALKRLIGAGAYVVPVIASFSMAALSVDGFLDPGARAQAAS